MVEKTKPKLDQLTARDAKKFLDVRTEGYENPTISCEKFGTCLSHTKACDTIALSEEECLPLSETFIYGKKFEVTPAKRANLEERGYAKSFVDGLAGKDGLKALQRRAHWLVEKLPVETEKGNRSKIYSELASLGSRSEEAADALIKELGSEDFVSRDKAITALATVCTAEQSEDKKPLILPKIVDFLKNNPKPEIRAAAAGVLGRIKVPFAIETLPNLILAFDDPHYWVRNQALQAFGNIREQSKLTLFDVNSVFEKIVAMSKSDFHPICRQTAKDVLRKF